MALDNPLYPTQAPPSSRDRALLNKGSAQNGVKISFSQAEVAESAGIAYNTRHNIQW